MKHFSDFTNVVRPAAEMSKSGIFTVYTRLYTRVQVRVFVYTPASDFRAVGVEGA